MVQVSIAKVWLASPMRENLVMYLGTLFLLAVAFYGRLMDGCVCTRDKWNDIG